MTERTNSETESADDQRLIPIDSKWLETAFYLGILVWFIYLFQEAREWTSSFEYWGPMGILAIGFILVPLKIIDIHVDGIDQFLKRDEIQADETPESDTDEELEELNQTVDEVLSNDIDISKREEDKRAIILSAWIIAYPVAVYLMGFSLVTPPYLYVLLYYLTRDLKVTLITGTVVLIFFYVLFLEVLGVRLFTGRLNLPTL